MIGELGSELDDDIFKILLVRHVETEWSERGILQGWQDPPLDEAGRRKLPEVFSAIQRVSGGSPLMVSSPLARSAETADFIAERLDTDPPLYAPELRELSFGDWEGHTISDLERKPELKSAYDTLDPYFRWPGSPENLAIRAETAATFLQRLLDEVEDREIVAVSHGIVIQAVLAIWIHSDVRRVCDFSVPPGGVSLVTWGGKVGTFRLAASLNPSTQ